MFKTSVQRFEELVGGRRKDSRCDAELWSFMDRLSRNLRNLSNEDLADRWEDIAKNILYLIGPSRDADPVDAGAFSSWWWLQKLIHTEAELATRELIAPPAPDVATPIMLGPEFCIERATAPRYWVRIGKTSDLRKMLDEGEIRFGPASSYADPFLDSARQDCELEKTRKRPGQAITITLPDGRQGAPIGDVNFSRRSSTEVGDTLRDVEYWISSWSLEFDPRLFVEFSRAGAGAPPCDAAIVVWNTEALAKRVETAVDRKLPGWIFADIPIRYFDPYELQPLPALSPSIEKHFSFGYQRELRLGLASQYPIEKGDGVVLTLGSLADIAGLYSADGHKIGGVGPSTWTAGS